MFAIIGIVVVFGCVVAGYLMEHGNLRVLIQPAELVTIGAPPLEPFSSPIRFTSSNRLRAESAEFSAVPNTPSRPTSIP